VLGVGEKNRHGYNKNRHNNAQGINIRLEEQDGYFQRERGDKIGILNWASYRKRKDRRKVRHEILSSESHYGET